MRCAECAESWFVPAPTPVENLMPLKPKSRLPADEPRRDASAKREGRIRFDDAYEDDVDEPLFEAAARRSSPDSDAEPRATDHSERDNRVRQQPSHRRTAAHEPDRSDRREHIDGDELVAKRGRRSAKIVDADFEDVEGEPSARDDAPLGRGFGRKIHEDRDEHTDREGRRGANALVRFEDFEPIAERVFNEEFFTALRVQPKELERAIRKARRRAEARDKNRLTPLRAFGWSAFVGAIAAAGFVAYSYRNDIVAMFPNALGAYEAIGIEASPYGLKIEGVTHRVAMSPGGPVIEILGRLKNEGSAEVATPMLQAEAVGADGRILTRWTFAARSGEIKRGETIDFSTRTAAPEGVSEVLLSFAPAEGVKVSVGDLLKSGDPE